MPSDDSCYLISGSEDGLIYIWNDDSNSLDDILNSSSTGGSKGGDKNRSASFETFMPVSKKCVITTAQFAPICVFTKMVNKYGISYNQKIVKNVIVATTIDGQLKVYNNEIM